MTFEELTLEIQEQLIDIALNHYALGIPFNVDLILRIMGHRQQSALDLFGLDLRQRARPPALAREQ